MVRVVLAVAMAALSITRAGAQAAPWRWSMGATGAMAVIHTRGIPGANIAPRRGLTVGITGRVGTDMLSLGFAFAEGTVRAGTEAPSRLVTGSAFLTVEPVPGLAMALGPHARATRAEGIVTRWLQWRLGLLAQVALVPDRVIADGAAWGVLGGEVNLPGSLGPGRGGAVGLRWQVGPAYLRATYGIEEVGVAGAPRRDTFEDLSVSVGLGWP